MVYVNVFLVEFFFLFVFIEVFVLCYLDNVVVLLRNMEIRVVDNFGDIVDWRKVLVQRMVVFNLIDVFSLFLLKFNLFVVIKEIVYYFLVQLF